MLYRAVCLEGGSPRLVKFRAASGATSPGALTCGASKALEDAGVAEVRARVTQGDVWRAFGASETAQLSPATKTPARSTELASLLAQVAPSVDATVVTFVAITLPASPAPDARFRAPEWGALSFEPSGKLLVRGPSAVSRWDPETGEISDAQVPLWPVQVLSPDGKRRLLEAFSTCEGLSYRTSLASTTEASSVDVVLPVAVPLGLERCVTGRAVAGPLVPLAWSEKGLEVMLGGQMLLVKPDVLEAVQMATPLFVMPPFGSPRSAGGRAMAFAMPVGVVVKAARAARYRAPELEPYAELRHCTTTDDASRIACVKRDGRVVVATFPAL
jgi:hypothetical protein